MANEGLFTLQGAATPEEVRARIGKAGLAEDLALAQMPKGRGQVALASQAGRMLSGLLPQKESPEILQAQRAQEALTKLKEVDFSDPVLGYRNAAKIARDAGDLATAFDYMKQADALDIENKKALSKLNTDRKMSALRVLQADRDLAISEGRIKDAESLSRRIQKEEHIADSKWRNVLNPILAKIKKNEAIPKGSLNAFKVLLLSGEQPISLEMINALGTIDKKFKAMGIVEETTNDDIIDLTK